MREKNKVSTELMALQAKKNDAMDPTEELERELEIATEVNYSRTKSPQDLGVESHQFGKLGQRGEERRGGETKREIPPAVLSVLLVDLPALLVSL